MFLPPPWLEVPTLLKTAFRFQLHRRTVSLGHPEEVWVLQLSTLLWDAAQHHHKPHRAISKGNQYDFSSSLLSLPELEITPSTSQNPIGKIHVYHGFYSHYLPLSTNTYKMCIFLTYFPLCRTNDPGIAFVVWKQLPLFSSSTHFLNKSFLRKFRAEQRWLVASFPSLETSTLPQICVRGRAIWSRRVRNNKYKTKIKTE